VLAQNIAYYLCDKFWIQQNLFGIKLKYQMVDKIQNRKFEKWKKGLSAHCALEA
jgi:hypothetical protein